jgi:hypothetical protein
MSETHGLAGPALALRLEQVRRWRQGDRAPAEDYLARHPALAADAEYALEGVEDPEPNPEKPHGALNERHHEGTGTSS